MPIDKVIPQLKRPFCYETLKFNTADGDLHKGQYAVYNGQYLIRMHPENNFQWSVIDPFENPNYKDLIVGLTEVDIIPNEHCYYYEYVLKDGSERIVRFPMTKEEYFGQGKLDADVRKLEPNPTKKEADDIKKEDSKWL